VRVAFKKAMTEFSGKTGQNAGEIKIFARIFGAGFIVFGKKSSRNHFSAQS